MMCPDCLLSEGAKRITAYLKNGGKRLYLPAPGGVSIAEILGFTKTREVRLRDLNGREWEASPCSIPLRAFVGVS